MAPSEVFIPERARMYFFSLDTTMRMSRGISLSSRSVKPSRSPVGRAMAAAVDAGSAVAADAEDVSAAAGCGLASGARGGGLSGGGRELTSLSEREPMAPTGSAGLGLDRLTAGALLREPDDDDPDDDDDDEPRLLASFSCSSSRCHSAWVGERFSTAHASRWRIIGKCISQQPTEQNTMPVRLRLHVDTLHTWYIVENWISFLQLEHCFQKLVSAMARVWHSWTAVLTGQ